MARVPHDPKGAAGAAKATWTYMPLRVLQELAHVFKLGAQKYGPLNWRHSEDLSYETYINAAYRHLTAAAEGEHLDPESGRPHICHVMASMAILRDRQIIDNYDGEEDHHGA